MAPSATVDGRVVAAGVDSSDVVAAGRTAVVAVDDLFVAAAVVADYSGAT